MPHLMWCVASLFRSCRCHPLCDRALLVSLIIPACQDTRALKAKELKHHFVQNKKKKRLVGGLRLIACVCLTHSLQSSTYRTTCKENFKYIYVRVCVCVCIYKYIHIYITEKWILTSKVINNIQHLHFDDENYSNGAIWIKSFYIFSRTRLNHCRHMFHLRVVSRTANVVCETEHLPAVHTSYYNRQSYLWTKYRRNERAELLAHQS